MRLLVERDFQFVGELVGVERAERKVTAFDANRRHLALAVICLQHDRFSSRVVVNIDLAEWYPAFAQERFRAAAITAPGIGINGYFSHVAFRFYSTNI